MKTLPVLWQRLVKNGSTCPRCHDTGDEVKNAVNKLAEILKPLGITPVLETKEIEESTFLSDPLISNKVFVAGKPLEYWLNAQTGKSACCSECGDNECRTVEVEGQSYEVIPEEMIVRAGMIAALEI